MASISGKTTPAAKATAPNSVTDNDGPAGNWTEMEKNLPDVPQEDIEMAEAAGPVVTNHKVATKLSRKEVLVKLRAEVEALDDKILEIYSRDADSETDEKLCVELASKIANKQKVIETLTSVENLSSPVTGKGTAASKWATTSTGNKGLTLSRNNLPSFQLVGKNYPQFKGEKSYKGVEEFISTFEEIVVSANHELDEVWVKYIPITFPDELKAWMRKELFVCQSWVEAKKVLEKKFGNAQLRILATKELIAMKMLSNETISDFDNLFVQALENTDYSIEDKMIADLYFIALPAHWQTHVMTVIGAQKKDDEVWTASEIFQITFNIFTDKLPEMGNPSEQPEASKSKRHLVNHIEGPRPYKKRVSSTALHYCSYHGDNNSHTSAECTEITEDRAESSTPVSRNKVYRSNRSRPPPFCSHGCGSRWRAGHVCEAFYQKFPEKRPGNQTVLAVSANVKGKQAVRKESFENETYECKSNPNKDVFNPFKRLITPIIINDRKLKGKLDTGSNISCINKYLLDALFPNIKIKKLEGELNFLSNSSTKRLGQTEPMRIRYLNDISFEFCFEVVAFNDVLDTEFDVLLGIDILPKLNIGLTNVAHKYPDDEPSEDIQFENANHDPENKYDPENADYGTKEEREKFMKTIELALKKNAEIKPGQFCNIPESIVKIPIKKDATNCYVRQYALPYHARPEIKKQLESWLESGVVVESKPSNKYNSPLLAIGKKDENNQITATRICLDLRRQNLNIDDSLVENFTVPNIQDIFDKVSTGKVFSRLDLKSAYNSFKVDEASQEVLSFTFDDKTYKWVGTCFGLKFVTSQFCRVMNIIFNGEAQIATYVDDCCIFSDVENHAEIVTRAIEKLTAANLKINFAKCTFFKSSIYMLGFVVGPGITKIDQRRLSNINEWPIPKSAEQVRKIMGVVSYLRNYVPKISDIAAPLDALRNDKDVLNKWTSFHTDRLNNIKQILMSKAVLHTPDMQKKMYLETDASQYAASAVLTQRDNNGRTIIIAMASTSLPSSAQNWSVNRRELFAIYYGFQRFRSLLLGHQDIEVWTDHKAITFYYTTHIPNRTIQSYMDVLSEFSFSVTYIKGINNVLPDLLSRLYPE
ncbi:hypothetical protein INT48_007575, partial [Thamnidium elegans]